MAVGSRAQTRAAGDSLSGRKRWSGRSASSLVVEFPICCLSFNMLRLAGAIQSRQGEIKPRKETTNGCVPGLFRCGVDLYQCPESLQDK